MNGPRKFREWAIVGGLAQIVLLVFLVVAFQMVSSPAIAADSACSETSTFAQKACHNSATEAYNLALGKCENVAPGDKAACTAKALDDKKSALTLCQQQYSARQNVCSLLGGGPYNPNLDSSLFVSNPTGNTYFPLADAIYKYKTFAEDGTVTEKDVVKVTRGTRRILEITARVVRDTVTDAETGSVLEDTTDWYAEDIYGNVWYFGEIAQQFEDGILVGIEGSWTAGVDGAKPGIVMFASPQKNVTYRQEFALGDAEDVATVVGFVNKLPTLPPGVNLPQRVHGPFLHTQDFSALEPGVLEDKYYAPGVGMVLTVANDGTTDVLVSISGR